MITLRRNFTFCVRNQSRIRTISSLTHSNGIGNCSIIKLKKEFPVKSILCKEIDQLNYAQKVQFSTEGPTVSQLDYEKFCSETLDELGDYIEELVESSQDLSTADVLNKDGVLTVSLGSTHGTYVINKQSPNKQVWLSSPKSGPKRFDFVYAKDDSKNGYWFYKHTGETLHELLDEEFTEITKTKTNFQSLAFGKRR